MAILHGNWIPQHQGGYLFIWGETWRPQTSLVEAGRKDGILSHPLAMAQAELVTFLRSHRLDIEASPSAAKGKGKGEVAYGGGKRWKSHAIASPTRIVADKPTYPIYSPKVAGEINDLYLYPWEVEGLCLNATDGMKFLQALPLSSFKASDAYLGGELRFWAQVCRWSLDLLSRGKFIPGMYRKNDGSVVACWQPLLDSAVDRERLENFAQLLPGACRTYQDGASELLNYPFLDLPAAPEKLLLEFLRSTIDAQVRAWGNSTPPTAATPVREWLQALSRVSDNLVQATGEAVGRLETTLQNWTAAVQDYIVVSPSQGLGQNLYRTCFSIHPPGTGENSWRLEYFLQAADDGEFLVSAARIWNHTTAELVHQGRKINHPQETFLQGLGLAARLFAPIEPSLRERRPQSCLLTPLQAYEFIKSAAWRLKDSGLGVILPPSLASQEGWANRLGLKIQAETPEIPSWRRGGKEERIGLQSLLNFKWELSIGGQTLSKAEFDRLVAQNTPLVEINGEWVELRAQDVRAAQAFFASRKEQMALSLEDALRLSTGDTQMIEKLPVVSFEASGTLEELLSNLTNNRAIEPIVPKSFKGTLRPYQERGVGWLSFLEQWGLGACLADDMGLGKAIQFIAFILHLQEQEALEAPVLLLSPTSVLGNWEREVKKFGPSITTLMHHGDKRAKGKALAKAVKDKHLVITSYPLVFRDAKDLQSINWRGVVLDEAQNIKNPDAKQSKAVRELPTQFRIALTGTPVENRLAELWSIMDFLNPGYLGQRQFFQRRFGIPIEKYGDGESLKTLRSLVQPFILRRLKTDKEIIQDLPEKQEMTVFCPLTVEQATLYQKIVESSLDEIESADGIKRKGMILALITKLKQICNHPVLFKEKNETEKSGISSQQSGKLQRLDEMLEELVAEGDSALIFTQFAEWGKLLKPHLEKQLEQEVLFLYGSTAKKQREEMIDRFQNDPEGPKIFILSLKAGGVGLNLTRATHVFHFDRWWNPAVENQATDRVFRIGQTRNVQVHKFVCNGTLEEKIHDLIESKKALAEQVVGAGEQWLTELDTDQLRNLLILDRSSVIDDE
ncbi:DEAD/DEAH box helicase [Microseira sp. BLCC-F43]|uniref:DEAD/DEAH box helicase n=1 Tax=Microseira sp. BLCC-F43 TaxID=3153602 RepID=UPI0035B77676